MISFCLRKICSSASFLISPPYCVSCKQFLSEREPLCAGCRGQIYPVVSQPLAITATHEIQVYAMTAYDGIIRSLVLGKNYGQRLPSIQLGQLLAESDCCPWASFDVLVPTPLHWRRYALRGFNQAAIIAHTVARVRPWLQVVPALGRVRHTRSQSALGKGERRGNVESCFELDPRYARLLEGRRVLLVDDVMTTGATLRAMGKALKKVEVRSLAAVVAARTL